MISSKNSNYNTYYIYTEVLNSLVQGGRSSETSVNELLKEGHAEDPNGFVIKSKMNNC